MFEKAIEIIMAEPTELRYPAYYADLLRKADVPDKDVGDTIRRQVAIDALDAQLDYLQLLNKDENPTAESKWYGVNWAKNTIAELPSAQPERKKGKWIDAVLQNDNSGLPVQVCDQCNTFFPLAYTGGGHHFCPNCGADMRGSEQEG